MRQFYGVGPVVADKIMARLQFHDQLRVRDLSERQLNSLSALLSAPSAHPRPSTPLRPYSLASSSGELIPRDPPPANQDTLVNLQIEEDLLRKVRGDIAHLYSIGTWRGLRHAMRLPVRGQKSHPNAKSARKLNRLERRAYSTATATATTVTGASRPR
jgi:small subunit ribosomal protein S13